MTDLCHKSCPVFVLMDLLQEYNRTVHEIIYDTKSFLLKRCWLKVVLYVYVDL